MATLTVKARTKPADGKVNQEPAGLTRSSPGQDKGPIQKPADEVPSSCNSLREYLKANH